MPNKSMRLSKRNPEVGRPATRAIITRRRFAAYAQRPDMSRVVIALAGVDAPCMTARCCRGAQEV